MALKRPYVTNTFASYEGDKKITQLSLAIGFVDDFSNSEPLCPINVKIKKKMIKSIENLSGYHIFTDLPDDTYILDIESDLYFHENKEIDTVKIKNLDSIILNFDTFGPAEKDTSVRLTDNSNLLEGYVVEFRNSVGETEQRRLIPIDSENTIKWKKKLQYEFGKKSRCLFRWENVPDNESDTNWLIQFLKDCRNLFWVESATVLKENESDTDRLIQFLKDYLNLFWVESATVLKENENTIKISNGDKSVEITHDQVIEKALLKINDDQIYHLQIEEKDSVHNIYASTVRALDYLIEINLKPFPSYPFPDYVTLIRGLILNSEEDPIEEAQVKVVDYEIETKSAENGEFALYINKLNEFNVFGKNGDTKKIDILIKKNEEQKTVKTAFVKGKMEFLGKITFP